MRRYEGITFCDVLSGPCLVTTAMRVRSAWRDWFGGDTVQIVLTVESAAEHAAREEALRVVCAAARGWAARLETSPGYQSRDELLAAIALLKEKP